MAKTTAKLEALLEQVHEDVRHARFEDARNILAKLVESPLPRERRAAVAALARRAGVPDIGVRALHSIVRAERDRRGEATDREKAEYASCLVKLGATGEAVEMLDGLDAARDAQVHLYRAFARIAEWDYAGAIPLLDAYLASTQVSGYRRLVGEINLAAARLFESDPAGAERLLRPLLAECTAQGLRLLAGVAYEHLAQASLLQKKWSEGRDFLAQARSQLGANGGVAGLFVDKWGAILDLMEHPKDARALRAVEAMRGRAARARQWEVIRQCDFYEGLATGKAALLTRVYFGTASPAFRRAMLAACDGAFTAPATYTWHLGPPEGAARALDLATGGALDGGPALRIGEIGHRALAALARDLYRPHRLAALHAEVYPGEYYNPDSSPLRVHQALTSLRRWARGAALPARVEEEDGFYRLAADGPWALRLPSLPPVFERRAVAADALRAKFRDVEFSAKEAAEVLGTSSRNALRVLVDEVAAGRLQKRPAGPATRYRFRKPDAA